MRCQGVLSPMVGNGDNAFEQISFCYAWVLAWRIVSWDLFQILKIGSEPLEYLLGILSIVVRIWEPLYTAASQIVMWPW